ncbi:MAG: SUMF1/EgtB/PvdO family nonheme iron enzyme [Hyphomicrobiaceae bacterium]
MATDDVPTRHEESPGDDKLPAGSVVGKYRILGLLGRGGFGITYLAHDTQLGRDVAIKEYLPELLAMRQSTGHVTARSTRHADNFIWGRERFLVEARLLAGLGGTPSVVAVHDFIEANGTAYMVMALVRGESLESRLARIARLAEADLNPFVRPLLAGLDRVHAANVLHRDIKPSNIIIDGSGAPTLVDFGASRLALQGRTQAMTVVYTPGYAPPEQMSSVNQGPWTDIYATAAMLYHCIAGVKPPDAMNRIAGEEFLPASAVGKGLYSTAFLQGIDAALSLKISVRPQTIRSWQTLLFPRAPAVTVIKPASKPWWPVRRPTGDGKAPWGLPPLAPVASGIVSQPIGTTVPADRATNDQRREDNSTSGADVLRDRMHRLGLDGPELVWIGAGTFLMGAADGEELRTGAENGFLDAARPQTPIEIPKPLYVARFPVTVDEYRAYLVATNRRSRYARKGQNPSHPAVNVSSDDARDFAAWVGVETGQEGYRLPTEAEWEYVCRAGTTTARFWGDSWEPAKEFAHVEANGTAPVGSYKPNAFGVYDMLGNVWEWTSGPWTDDLRGSWTNLQGSLGDVRSASRPSPYRVLRGGSYDQVAKYVRAAYRRREGDGYVSRDVGFRVVRDA